MVYENGRKIFFLHHFIYLRGISYIFLEFIVNPLEHFFGGFGVRGGWGGREENLNVCAFKMT